MSQAGIINTESGPVPPTVATTYHTNAGDAVPALNILNVFGNTQAAGTSPVHTTGAGNTVTTIVQLSQALAATDATKVGLSNFNSAQFSVDANGFVSLAGGGEAIDSIGVQTGTNPIVPTAGGLVTINGAVVAAGTNPVRSDGTGANTMALEVQISQAIAATDATKIGLAAFDSADFSVDANGFVSLSATPNIPSYVFIDHAASPYTVTATDYYIATDSTLGTITINFPNAPAALREFVVKDRQGTAATNAVTITTPGGVVTIDGATSQTLVSNYASVQLLFNGTSYEIF